MLRIDGRTMQARLMQLSLDPRDACFAGPQDEAGQSHLKIYELVMPGLVPGIHVLGAAGKAWMAGTSPAMTLRKLQ
jgi:hypothetical protein